jgi:hypothetical protein
MPSYERFEDTTHAPEGLDALGRRDFLRLAALGAAGAAGAALGLPREAEAGRGGGASGRDPLIFGAVLDTSGNRAQALSWLVKVSSAKVGPGPNVFSDSENDVWVDGDNRLHLTITKYGSQWRCTEVIGIPPSDKPQLGYGTYRWTIVPGSPATSTSLAVSDISSLDPSVVLGLFTWNDAPEYNHREIDIEFAKWSDLSKPRNAQYTVQPWDGAGHRHEFLHAAPVPPAPTTHEFKWADTAVEFRSWLASVARPTTPTWAYSGTGIPVPGGENPRMNLWLFRGKPPASNQRVHIVLSDFTFTPA